jgi:hypothetical protein
LVAEFRTFPTALAIYMAGHMQEALIDLTSHGEPTPPDLYERFLAWVGNPCSEPAPSAAPPITAKRSAGRADGTGPSPARRRGSKRRPAAPAGGKAALNTGGGVSA